MNAASNHQSYQLSRPHRQLLPCKWSELVSRHPTTATSYFVNCIQPILGAVNAIIARPPKNMAPTVAPRSCAGRGTWPRRSRPSSTIPGRSRLRETVGAIDALITKEFARWNDTPNFSRYGNPRREFFGDVSSDWVEVGSNTLQNPGVRCDRRGCRTRCPIAEGYHSMSPSQESNLMGLVSSGVVDSMQRRFSEYRVSQQRYALRRRLGVPVSIFGGAGDRGAVRRCPLKIHRCCLWSLWEDNL